MATINFCGDSFCAKVGPLAWTSILANKLNAEIVGTGVSGSSHEQAIVSFNSKSDYTVFTWTEYNRLYKKDYPINTANTEVFKDKDVVYKAASWYYKYLHDKEYARMRQIRDLYWFDKEILAAYKGICLHLFCFEKTYTFSNGKNNNILLYPLSSNNEKLKDQTGIYNHFTTIENKALAELLAKQLRGK
jgi:hypothetical protein